jgi:phytoene synthase
VRRKDNSTILTVTPIQMSSIAAASMTDHARLSLGKERSSFFYSFSFLPRAEREAMHRIYEFCRFTDDLVDEENANETVDQKRQKLDWWRGEVEKCYEGTSEHPILRSLQKIVRRFEIPKEYLLTLIDGVEMDLDKTRYETFEELKQYCYAVASVVGLISIQVFGHKHEETREYAIQLGYALQLTNILRDVEQDASNGRIYLPQEDLRRFEYSEQELLNGTYNQAFRSLMAFESDRAKQYYSKAHNLLHEDEHAALFAARIMDAIYFRLLRKIERAEFNVFSRRISVSAPHKLGIALKFWANRYLHS